MERTPGRRRQNDNQDATNTRYPSADIAIEHGNVTEIREDALQHQELTNPVERTPGRRRQNDNHHLHPIRPGLPPSTDIANERGNSVVRREDTYETRTTLTTRYEDTEERRQTEEGPRKHRAGNPPYS